MRNVANWQSASAIVVCCYLLLLTPGVADDAVRQRIELSKWVMTYYQKPAPEEFVQKVKELSAAGLLHNSSPNSRPDANVMFLGKIMAGNATLIPEWMEALSSLPDADRKVLSRAVWYSGAEEGMAWLVEHGEGELANGPRPMLLAKEQAMQLQPYHIDQLWEWFFATGEEEPVLRIVSLFSLAHEPPKEDSLELLSPPAESDDKTRSRIQTYNYGLLKPALWSTTSLAIQHDRVLEILKKTREKHYHEGIKAWLGQVIKIAETQRSKMNKAQPAQ